MNNKWFLQDAIKLCKKLELIAPAFGGHVALTGGCLYKNGPRKDLDILIYRSTDEDPFDWDGFFGALERHGFQRKEDYGFCKKAWYFPEGEAGPLMCIDFLDPFGEGGYSQSDSNEIKIDGGNA